MVSKLTTKFESDPFPAPPLQIGEKSFSLTNTIATYSTITLYLFIAHCCGSIIFSLIFRSPIVGVVIGAITAVVIRIFTVIWGLYIYNYIVRLNDSVSANFALIKDLEGLEDTFFKCADNFSKLSTANDGEWL